MKPQPIKKKKTLGQSTTLLNCVLQLPCYIGISKKFTLTIYMTGSMKSVLLRTKGVYTLIMTHLGLKLTPTDEIK